MSNLTQPRERDNAHADADLKRRSGTLYPVFVLWIQALLFGACLGSGGGLVGWIPDFGVVWSAGIVLFLFWLFVFLLAPLVLDEFRVALIGSWVLSLPVGVLSSRFSGVPATPVLLLITLGALLAGAVCWLMEGTSPRRRRAMGAVWVGVVLGSSALFPWTHYLLLEFGGQGGAPRMMEWSPAVRLFGAISDPSSETVPGRSWILPDGAGDSGQRQENERGGIQGLRWMTGGLFRAGCVLPLEVVVSGGSSGVEGKVLVETVAGQVVEQPVVVPSRSHRRVILLVRPIRSSSRVRVVLRAGGSELARTLAPPLERIQEGTRLTGLIASSGEDRLFLPPTHPGERSVRLLFLPPVSEGFALLDRLVVVAAPDSYEGDVGGPLVQWVEQGGQLVVGERWVLHLGSFAAEVFGEPDRTRYGLDRFRIGKDQQLMLPGLKSSILFRRGLGGGVVYRHRPESHEATVLETAWEILSKRLDGLSPMGPPRVPAISKEAYRRFGPVEWDEEIRWRGQVLLLSYLMTLLVVFPWGIWRLARPSVRVGLFGVVAFLAFGANLSWGPPMNAVVGDFLVIREVGPDGWGRSLKMFQMGRPTGGRGGESVGGRGWPVGFDASHLETATFTQTPDGMERVPLDWGVRWIFASMSGVRLSGPVRVLFSDAGTVRLFNLCGRDILGGVFQDASGKRLEVSEIPFGEMLELGSEAEKGVEVPGRRLRGSYLALQVRVEPEDYQEFGDILWRSAESWIVMPVSTFTSGN
ncbi:MAG: hypothetical protein QF752_09650 [Planctomycetota bacterium]|nr:hypothetical protein [Planctomycetota bacterium]